MAFFDKLGANLTNAGRIGAQKMKNLSEATSLGNEQKTEKKNIQTQFCEIGRMYFEKYKDAPDAEFAEQIASILASEKRIAELENEIAAVRAREPELVEVPEDPKPTAAAPAPSGDPTSMVCMQCGSTYATDKETCDLCHTPLVAQYGGEPVVRTEPNPITTEVTAASEEAKPTTLDGIMDVQPEAPAEPEAPKTEDAPENKAAFCPYCGKPVSSDMAFCASCGKKL